MKNRKRAHVFLALFFAVVFGLLARGNAFAETAVEKKIVEDGNHVRWEYQLETNTETNAQKLSIFFYDKPADATTVTIPSLQEVLDLVPNADDDLDTYLLKSANTANQDSDYPDFTRRESTANIKKLDFTYTSKIQVFGVKPMIDQEDVTELVFGDNMVIGDSGEENANTGVFAGYNLKLTNFSGDKFNYVGWDAFANTRIDGKTVTISGDSFKGGNIFQGSNVEKVIINTNTIGIGIFRNCVSLTEVVFGDNVTRVTDDAFAGATGLKNFDFSDTNIKTIGPRAFKDAHLKSIDLDGVNRIEYMAFANNDLTELVLPKSINYLQSQLFQGNSKLKKLTVAYDTLTSGTTLPMFVVLDNYYGASTSSGEPSGTIEELNLIAPYGENDEVSDTHVLYGDYLWRFNAYDQHYMPECPDNTSCNGNSAAGNDYVHAQYGAWESNYYSYYGDRENYRGSGSDYEKIYAHVDTYKNVIAPIYFANMMNLHKITIGDGYEFIGASAFQDWSGSYDNMGTGTSLIASCTENTGHFVRMPDSLRGVGNGAFVHKFTSTVDIKIPKNIEFIGINAFFNTYCLDGDVDFPNLVALGDHAFEKTRTRNIYLYDKLQYMGAQVFSGCAFLNDITFDLDVFSPNIYIAWALPHRHGPEWYDGQFHITTEFGPRFPGDLDVSKAKQMGVRVNEDQMNNFWPMKFGTITFTDKNVSQLPNGYHNCYYSADDYNSNLSKCPGGTYGTGIYNTFFGHINADKVDLGSTAWKVLSPRMFVQAAIDEVVLPHNLEVIPGDSFSDAYIKKELVLPDTLKVIGDAAFDYGYTYSNAKNWSTGEINEEYLNNHTIHITKLPDSLEYVGNDAFWADYGLGVDEDGNTVDVDLNAKKLWHVGYKSFWGTHLRDVYLPPTIKSMNAASFANISTLRNITIDFDLGALPPNFVEPFKPEDFPQSARDYAGANLYPYITMSCSAHGMADSSSYPVTTFYSLFNQKIVEDVHDPNNWYRILSYGQKTSETHYGKVIFTKNNKTDIYMTGVGYFAGLEFDELDLGETEWKHTVKNVPFGFEETKIGKLTLPHGLETVTMGAFEKAQIRDPFDVPDTLKTIAASAFQWAKGEMKNAFAEGLETIDNAAFYAADMADELVIPSTVTRIGYSAFNAGDADVHYDKVTVKPDLTASTASGQLVHQMFWNADIDKLKIESEMLVGLEHKLNGDFQDWHQEFYAMPIKELTVTKLPEFTPQACASCTQLTKVDASKDSNLRAIDDEAFLNAEQLHIFKFSPDIKDETVTVGQHAFQGTAFETMGDSGTDFDLTAAKFDGSRGLAFAEMPKLRKVDIPDGFSKNTIPVATFHNDGELAEATLDYHISKMETAAFSNDEKLERIFIWGNTVVEDEKLDGYTAPTVAAAPVARLASIRLANVTLDDGEEIDTTDMGLTIPDTTDIYAYSVSPTESYAGKPREDFEGDFYPLDEVLYITSNKPRVLLNDDEDDFDKSDLIIYGLRRDGVILQSNKWGEFDGTVYPRSDSNLTFERMAGVQEENPVFGAVYDTPVPLNELDFGNTNFENISFELVRDPEDQNVRLVNIVYTDKYTKGEPDTDIDPNKLSDEPTIPEIVEEVIEKIPEAISKVIPEVISKVIPEAPFTGDRIGAYVISFVVFSLVAAGFIIKRRK